MTAALLAQNDLLNKATGQTEKLSAATGSVGGVMRTVAGYTQSVAGNIASATDRLLKWTGIFSAVSGLVGLGGLFGLEHLAGEASEGRRATTALGLPYGELQAFQATVGGRYLNANAFLGNIATGLSDITSTQYRALLAAGLQPGQLQNQDTGQAALESLPAIQRLLQRTPSATLGPMLEATGLSSLLSLGEARTLRATPQAELADVIRQTRAEQQALTLPPETLKKWQDLNVQLDLAGRNIRAALIEGLSPLTPQLQRLSAAFTNVISSFLRSPEVHHLMDVVADGLNHFADYLTSPDFGKDVSDFTASVGRLATGAHQWIDTLANTFNTISQKDQQFSDYIGRINEALGNALSWLKDHLLLGTTPSPDDKWKQSVPPGNVFNIDPLGDMAGWWQQHAPTWLGGWSQGKTDFLKAIEPGEGGAWGYAAKLDRGSIAGLHRDKYDYPIGAGAAGAYQFRRRTWDEEAAKLGLHDFSPHSQNLAAWDLAATRFQQKTHRALEDTLNAGDIDSVIQALRRTWTSFDKPEVIARLHEAFRHDRDQNKHSQKDDRIRGDMRQNTSFNVRNQTGSGVMITGGALAGAYGY